LNIEKGDTTFNHERRWLRYTVAPGFGGAGEDLSAAAFGRPIPE